MANPLSSKRNRLILFGLVGLALVCGLVWWLRPTWLVPTIATLLSVLLLWLLVEMGAKLLRQRRQRGFDEKVAAKEGIEDRRREWQSWAAELKKQGIDKSSLPFFLLVGEPQSGKSVLLQNSDLRFPFGQSRLSGIGGTRGCDWWFTDEAVILDLAGRLFTHEGGRADEAEWEAFLDILAEYRPLCPADGVILVLPCDSLLTDDEEVSRDKANRIQHSLLTLINRLQARLPVYVVLTKGDKVFGFAESVHRLDALKRHEMFGWSREGDNYDRPFELHEARTGFESLVERARALRSSMLSSARIPEALGEVDRLYAFPDELAALEAPLESYLRAIFSESSLVDRLFFRGLYLTSGLQSGMPIAKVCGEMLGGGGEADRRELEALFAKQRAYFIKDFVRKRMFSERGLVQPTGRRVTQSRRNATIGYGAAGLVALASIVGSGYYLSQQRSTNVVEDYESAVTISEELVARDATLPRLLTGLSLIDDALDVEPEVYEKIFSGSPERFGELYRRIFDERFQPKLRALAEEALVRELFASDPTSHAGFLQQVDALQLLLDGFDLMAETERATIERLVPARLLVSDADAKSEFDLRDAIDARRRAGGEPPRSRPAEGRLSEDLERAIDRVIELWDGAVTYGSPWQVGGETGYLIAWEGLERAYDQLGEYRIGLSTGMHAMADQYSNSRRRLLECQDALPTAASSTTANPRFQLSRSRHERQLRELRERREAFLEAARREDTSWPALTVERFAENAFEGNPRGAAADTKEAVGELLGGGAPVDVPTDRLAKALGLQADGAQGPLATFARPEFLPLEFSSPDLLREQLTTALARPEPLRPGARAERGVKVLFGKLLELAPRYAERYADWEALAAELPRRAAGDESLQLALVVHTSGLRTGLRTLDPELFADWIARLESLLGAHLEAGVDEWARSRGALPDEAPPGPDWELVAALFETESAPAIPARVVNRANEWTAHFQARVTAQIRSWEDASPRVAETTRMVGALNDHLAALEKTEGLRDVCEQRGVFTSWSEDADALLDARLGRHFDELRANWSSPPHEEWTDLREAVGSVLAMLQQSELSSRLTRDGQIEARDLRLGELDALVERSKRADDSVSLPRTLARLEALHAYAKPSTSSLGAPLSQLTTYVRRFDTSAPGVDRGLAGDGPALLALALEAPDPSVYGGHSNAAYRFLEDVAKEFGEFVIGEVRRLYLGELRETLDAYRPLLGAIFAEDEQQLGNIEAWTVQTQLETLLDPGARLDELRDRYLDGDQPAELRPDPLDSGDPAAAEWELHRFLIELQAWLLGDKQTIREHLIGLRVRPRLSAQDSIWRDPTYRCVLRALSRAEDGGDWEVHPLQSYPDLYEGSWRISQSNHFEIRFAQSFKKPPGPLDAGEAAIVVRSPLAPFWLAWMAARSGDSFEVDRPLSGSTLRAPFQLSFVGGPPPMRPPSNPYGKEE